MTMQELTEFLDKKIANNKDYIIITHYEVRIALDLSKEESEQFIQYCKTRLENLDYNVYKTGEHYVLNNNIEEVKSNELIIAIKNKERINQDGRKNKKTKYTKN